MHDRKYYKRLRRRFLPDDIRLIFIAESPPVSGKYFYNPAGRPTEPLFRALLYGVLGMKPAAKTEGLTAFAKAGCLLIDATYRPVNALAKKDRNRILLADYRLLKRDLATLPDGRNIPIVLIKANVCRLLEEKLSADGFRVANRGTIIPFPGSGQAAEFFRRITPLIRRIT